MSSHGFRDDYADRSRAETPISLPSKCPACRSAAITTTAKTPAADSYWRCGSCGEIWNDARTRGARSGAGRWR